MTSDINGETDRSSLRVLLVEDNDADYLLLLRRINKLLNPQQCGRATNRSELLAALGQAWDLIISDFHLLDVAGEELLGLIEAAQPRTPCLILSGSIESVEAIGSYRNVFAVAEKGDHATLSAALSGAWRKA